MMWHQVIHFIWGAKHSTISCKESLQSYSSVGNLIVLSLLFLPEFVALYLLWFSDLPHKISMYYFGMVAIPVFFILASGNCRVYVSMLRTMYHNLSWRTLAVAVGTWIMGFMIQNLIFLTIAHHTEWSFWRASVWKDSGNIVFLSVNPVMETFFWRFFMHTELALRWFPSKSQSDEQLLSLTTGTPVLPRLSRFGTALNAAAFSLYHYVPIVMYDLPIYSHAGMTYHMALIFLGWLFIFGILAIYVRENLGILAAWALHLGVDTSDVLFYTYIMIQLTGHPSYSLFKSWQ